MDRPGTCGLKPRGRGWRRLALAAALLAAGCKPGDPAALSVEDMEPEELLSHLKLAGLVRDGSRQWALLLVAVPGGPTEHLKLMPGQRLGGLEIRSIDHAAQTVDVRAGDRDLTLSEATHGLKPEDGYPWLQRLSADEHARLHNSPERQQLVDEHSRAQAERQLQELERELEERGQIPPPSSPDGLETP
jgi:hypothetical protein